MLSSKESTTPSSSLRLVACTLNRSRFKRHAQSTIPENSSWRVGCWVFWLVVGFSHFNGEAPIPWDDFCLLVPEGPIVEGQANFREMNSRNAMATADKLRLVLLLIAPFLVVSITLTTLLNNCRWEVAAKNFIIDETATSQQIIASNVDGEVE